MDTVVALWMPIVLSAILVFLASTVIHMVFKWHKSEFRALPKEAEVRSTLRGAPPGQYMTPYCGDMKDLRTPEMQQKFVEGPIAFVTVRENGLPKMGPAMSQWFLYSLVVAAVAGYLAARTLPPGATSGQIWRVVGTVSFVAYAFGSVQYSIWMGKPWRATLMDMVDALIYSAANACAFASLWPR